MPAYLSVAVWRATTATLGVLALTLTTIRVWLRFRKRHLWWDDYWAMISQFFSLINCVAAWFRDDDRSPHSSTEQRVVVHWVATLTFQLIVWSARISIAMSIARFIPPKTKMRRFIYTLSVFFVLACAAFVARRIWVCTRSTSWHHTATVVCYQGKFLGIFTLCTDIPADTCLVLIPLHMLWHVKLPRRQRSLILIIFAASVLSSIAGVVYAVFSFEAQKRHSLGWSRLTGLAGSIKAAVTLLVCNLLVVATYVYCLLSKDEEEEVSEPSETRSKPTVPPPPTTIVSLTVISDQGVTDSSTSSGRFNSATQMGSSKSDLSPDQTAHTTATFSTRGNR